jgi:hypothetical protein
MSKKFVTFLFAAMVLFAWPAANLVAQTNSSTKAAVATKTTGHPEKSTTAVAVHQTAKTKPAAKLEKIPKAPHENTSWVSGDYYWDGNNWQWDGGYWLDNPRYQTRDLHPTDEDLSLGVSGPGEPAVPTPRWRLPHRHTWDTAAAPYSWACRRGLRDRPAPAPTAPGPALS